MSEDEATAPDPAQLLAYIERFGTVLADSGIPRMPARVFAALLTADDGRLTSQQLADLLGISAAAVSGAIRYLSQVGLVTRERDPGSRRDRYRVLDEVWQEAILQRESILVRWETSLAEGVAVVGPDSPAGRRLGESVMMFQFLRRELPGLLNRWHEHRATLRAEVARADAVARALGAGSAAVGAGAGSGAGTGVGSRAGSGAGSAAEAGRGGKD